MSGEEEEAPEEDVVARVPMAVVVIDQSVLLEEKARKELVSDKVLLEKFVEAKAKYNRQ